jgi:hypothetical protein
MNKQRVRYWLLLLLVLVLCPLLVTGCSETGARGVSVTRKPAASPAELAQTTGGIQTGTQQVGGVDASAKGIWFYDENVLLPWVLYNATGLQFSMILGADGDHGMARNATREATWQVGNPAVATCEGGVITVLAAGKTVISAQYGQLRAETSLEIFDGKPDYMLVDADGGKTKVGGAPLELNIQLGFDGRGEYPANEFAQVHSRNPETAKVAFKDGELLIYGVRAGKAEVTVSAFGLSQTVEVTVSGK